MGCQASTLLHTRETAPEPSVASALGRVLEASERVIIDRIDLMRLDTRDALAHALRSAVLLAGGGVLLCGGWFAAMAIVVVVLDDYATPGVRYAIVACLSLITGALLVVRGLHRLPRPPSAAPNRMTHG